MKKPIKLHDVLYLMPRETLVGIWDCRGDPLKEHKRGYEVCPTPQKYQKIKNIPYEKLRYILDAEVYTIAHTEKGIFIKIMEDREKVSRKIDRHELAREIGKELKR